jgi:hypothetical protein
MYQRTTCLDSIFCIQSPHMLHAIMRNGTPVQRADAQQALEVDHTLRTLRMAFHGIQRHPVVQATGGLLRAIFNTQGTQTLPGNPVRHEGSSAAGDPTVSRSREV